MVNTEIRLIIFFAAKDGEVLYSQQKQDQELTVAQIMNSLLPNSDWNWRKWAKPLDHSDNGDLLQKIPCMYCYTQCPQPCSRPPLTHASSGDSWTQTGKSGSLLWGHCSFLLGPGAQGSVCALQESISQSCVSSGSSTVGLMATSSKRAYAIPKSAVHRALSLWQKNKYR